MTIQDQQKTTQILAACLKVFPNSKADEETIYAYLLILDDLTYPQVRAALLKLMRTAKFFPTPAEILTAAEEMERTASNNLLPTPGEAWEEVMRLAKVFHESKEWVYSCHEVELAVKQYGKRSLIEMKADNIGTVSAQFQKIYIGIIEQERNKKHNQEVLRRMGPDVANLITGTANAHDMNQLPAPKKEE